MWPPLLLLEGVVLLLLQWICRCLHLGLQGRVLLVGCEVEVSGVLDKSAREVEVGISRVRGKAYMAPPCACWNSSTFLPSLSAACF